MLSTEIASFRQSLRQQILSIHSRPSDQGLFEQLALSVFRYQATHNPIYRDYLQHLASKPEQVTDLSRVPFMPISFFKNHNILTGFQPQPDTLTFASSGTTGEQTSRHFVSDPDLYDAISTRIFEQTYGSLGNFHIVALLPSYLERNNSSLVYMVQRFMAQTGSDKSGFFLHNHHELTEQLRQLTQEPDQKKILLIGVTFGLLDWAESGQDLSFLGQNPNLIVMETGGMKGRRQELLREEVHQILIKALGIQTVHSEYGMTELLSQAYSNGNGLFQPSPTLRVFLRDINDPFLIYPDDYKRTGGINVVDLANLDSCSFIETQDLGQYDDNEGSFRVIGRFDNSDVRGCNLMVI
ncbi:LuxE/PaaK family acyltransferase [Spirosoma endbachense]|uniref:Acyl transferase n=1 Tax=Spirosoma endbachense TaxID=2666025 RepID=A0A6P1W4F8_9BACT|nr:acyl transferase [Spirosoma endbachense]QHV98889.1 acyl transferase [Spirosoma endbachense]